MQNIRQIEKERKVQRLTGDDPADRRDGSRYCTFPHVASNHHRGSCATHTHTL